MSKKQTSRRPARESDADAETGDRSPVRLRPTLLSLLLWNGAYALAVFLGFFAEWTWLAWLVTGFTISMLAAYFAVLVSEESRRKFVGQSYPMPVWMLRLFDVTIVAALASREASFSASVYTASALVLRAVETDFWRQTASRKGAR